MAFEENEGGGSTIESKQIYEIDSNKVQYYGDKDGSDGEEENLTVRVGKTQVMDN